MLAELVHRKLNLCDGSIAHMKTRVPQIRTQESFAHGTASVHVELLIPQSVALSAVLSEQVPVKVSSFLASATECETNGGRRGRRRATHVLHITSRVQFSVGIRQLQVSGWTCSPLSETHAIRRSAASSLRPGAAPKNRASRCASSQEPVLQDGFRSMRSSLLGVLSQASAAFGINLLPWTLRCCNCNVYLCPGRDVCKVCQRCVLHGWAADHKNAIVVDMSSWMSSVLSGAPEISRSAASSLRPGTAPGNCACQCTSQEPVLQRRFRSIRFRLLGLLGQASAACGIDVFPCAFVVTSTLSSAGSSSNHIRSACYLTTQLTHRGVMSLQLEWPTKRAGNGKVCFPRPEQRAGENGESQSGAIVQISGWMRSALSWAPDISPSSLRPGTAPGNCACQCTSQEPVLQRRFRSMRFRLLGLLGQASAVYLCSIGLVRGRCAAAESLAKQIRDVGCMAGLPRPSRAILQGSGWIRPPLASTHAIPRSAASSIRQVAVLLCGSSQCRCSKSILQGCFGSVQSWHVFFSKQGSLLDLGMADAVPPASAERFKPTAAGFFARRVGHLSCWIRSPCPTAHAIRPPAYSFGPVAAPVGFCVRRRRRGRLLKGYFGCVQTWHLSFYRQEGTHSLLDLCSCVVRFTFPGFSAKQVHDACMAALTTGRAIVQVSGWIRPPFASVPRILPSPAGTAHDKGKQRSLAGFIGQNVHAPVLARRAHKSSSELCSHSVSCMRFQERDPSRSLRPVRVARKKDPVLRSSGSVAPPSPMKSMPLSPSPLPSAAWVLRLQGAVRSVFRPDIEEAVEANCLVISPVDETLSQAQVPFILMIRHLFSLLPSHALQDREVLLNLVLVGHSHGGVVGHSLTQSLECAGFLVKGIVAVDTLGLPRWSGMPLPRFDPQGLIRNLSPYHWQLTAPTVNMMAPEVPRLFLLFPLCEFPDGIPSSFLSL